MDRAPLAGVILAGGGARRLGGVDKGAALVAGKRLFDHVYERLAPQVDRVLVAGPNDYGVDAVATPDRPDGPRGPAAGLFAALHWLSANAPDVCAFVTAPVDAPLLPRDFVGRLHEAPSSAIVRCGGRRHPTFARWETGALSAYFQSAECGEAPALHEIAAGLNARDAAFDDDAAFFNVNTPEDVAKAEALIASRG